MNAAHMALFSKNKSGAHVSDLYQNRERRSRAHLPLFKKRALIKLARSYARLNFCSFLHLLSVRYEIGGFNTDDEMKT